MKETATKAALSQQSGIKKQSKLVSISVSEMQHVQKYRFDAIVKKKKTTQSSSARLGWELCCAPFWICYVKRVLSVSIHPWSRLDSAFLVFWAGQLAHGPGLCWRRPEILCAGQSGSAQRCIWESIWCCSKLKCCWRSKCSIRCSSHLSWGAAASASGFSVRSSVAST